MNKFVKFAGDTVGVVTRETPTGFTVMFHNGKKVISHVIDKRTLTPITGPEFRKAVLEKGQMSMLQFLLTESIEQIVWQTDPDALPEINKPCLIFIKGIPGTQDAVWSGRIWKLNDGSCFENRWIKAWAYEPKGPKS